MQEEKDFGGVRVAFREGEEVEIIVSDVEVLQALPRTPVVSMILYFVYIEDADRGRRKVRRRYIYAFIRETGWDGGTFFFGFGEEDREFFDRGHGDVATVVAG